MQPINNKSLLHFIFDQMEKLDKDEIDVQTAKGQANLAKQANNSLKYELDRASLQKELDSYNRQAGSNLRIRNVEGKEFD